MALPGFAYLNGRIVSYNDAKVGLLTHTLNYGTGAFGGIRGYWNDEEDQLFVFRPYDHFRRLLQSAKLLRMAFSFTPEQLTEGTLELLRTEGYHEDVYIRPLVFYGDEIIGVRLHNLTPNLSVVSVPFGRYVDQEEGAHVTVSSWRRVDDNAIPARGKITGSYVNSALAKTDAQLAGFDEAIVLNQDGHIAEGSAENLFMIRNGMVVTPPITENILEGITRRTMMQLLREELGMEVVERQIDRTELFLCDELFFSGTGVQLTSIIKVDNRPIGNGVMGQTTKALRELYFNVVRGRVAKYRHFCVPVYAEQQQQKKKAKAVGEAK